MTSLLTVALALAAPPAGPAARVVADPGAVVTPTGPGTAELVPAGPVAADTRLVLLPGAGLASLDGTAVAVSRADPAGVSPLPVYETALIPWAADPGKVDLEFTLDRGRVDIQNQGTSAVAVAVRLPGRRWLLTLDKPGTRVAVELVGRWPAGTEYVADPPPGRGPVYSAQAVALSGSAAVSDGETTVTLSAPPGPALLTWTSDSAARPAPVRLAAVPAWAADDAGPTAQAMARSLAKFRALRAADPGTAIDAMLASADPADKRVGLVEAGAADDLPRLAKTVAGTTDPDAWDAGVSVFRHWLGRDAQQEGKLVQFLTARGGFTPARAALVVRLLNGFSPAELRRPETYEVLVEYLRHDTPAVRGLAAWHLIRLVPGGKAVGVRPNGSKADADAAYKRFRELVPPGKLPGGGK